MIISNAHRFVMLAPWKTASTTSHELLAPYNQSPYPRFHAYNPHLQRVVTQHLTYADFQGLPESRLGYFTASFVRNPYDRVYSAFTQLPRDLERQPQADFPTPWVRALVMAQMSRIASRLAEADFDFDRWWGLVEEHQIHVVGDTSLPLHPAHYWTGGFGQPQVDFVGKVERYEEDIAAFSDAVGIPPPAERVVANAADDRAVGGDGYRYAERMSPSSRSKIETLFRKDFELFGYEAFRP